MNRYRSIGSRRPRDVRLLASVTQYQGTIDRLRRIGACCWTIAPNVPGSLSKHFLTGSVQSSTRWRRGHIGKTRDPS